MEGNFRHVTGPNILREVRRNLVDKLGLNQIRVDRLLGDILDVSSAYVPKGKLNVVGYAADDLVLEVAVLGNCDVLVTGDKKHLLPLSTYRGMIIEPPSGFLRRLEG